MQRFRGGLVFKAHRLCVSLNSRLASNKEEEAGPDHATLEARGSSPVPEYAQSRRADEHGQTTPDTPAEFTV